MATVLLEIGTEEMPAGYLPPALAQLAALASARLAVERITCDGIQTWATPRRLALLLTGVAERQAPETREVRGPAADEAFTEFGEPTAAALGFARGHGAQVSELRLIEADGVEYVAAIFRDEGRPTQALLPAVFTDLITGLTFPKTMRWGVRSIHFARPIRWIVAMMDEQVVPVTVGEVTASSATRGHRFLAPGAVEIPTAADYPRIMDENQVLLAPETRRAVITEQLETIAAQDNATVADDGALLDETVYRVEYPTAVRCTFDPEFLALPEEVLVQTLREEQKFFPLREITGRLLPAFIAVRNGDKAYLSAVRAGYEVVARAKLLDAQFFFEQDRQRALADRLADLREVVILERVGTLYDKAQRLQALAGWIADELGLPAHE
ncbi:MAG TPA: glycine--tRNA ligase subunit beta, partial [Armatimonadota bacterium]|nr:glycine--tRNA ligase subunit beta [Armatimonadota bacterium]